MSITASDIAPFSEARPQPSALASLERAYSHLLLLHEIEQGLADVGSERHRDAREALQQIKQSRAKSASI